MNKFRQHIPTFVDTDKPLPIYKFETTEELLRLEVVQRYSKWEKFSYFAIGENYLMIIGDDGFYWWVVGYVDDPTTVDLPKWDGPKYKAELPNGEKVILSEEVVSSCGDTLTLRNGTKAKDLRNK